MLIPPVTKTRYEASHLAHEATCLRYNPLKLTNTIHNDLERLPGSCWLSSAQRLRVSAACVRRLRRMIPQVSAAAITSQQL
jgi:hypothetical protein